MSDASTIITPNFGYATHWSTPTGDGYPNTRPSSGGEVYAASEFELGRGDATDGTPTPETTTSSLNVSMGISSDHEDVTSKIHPAADGEATLVRRSARLRNKDPSAFTTPYRTRAHTKRPNKAAKMTPSSEELEQHDNLSTAAVRSAVINDHSSGPSDRDIQSSSTIPSLSSTSPSSPQAPSESSETGHEHILHSLDEPSADNDHGEMSLPDHTSSTEDMSQEDMVVDDPTRQGAADDGDALQEMEQQDLPSCSQSVEDIGGPDGVDLTDDDHVDGGEDVACGTTTKPGFDASDDTLCDDVRCKWPPSLSKLSDLHTYVRSAMTDGIDANARSKEEEDVMTMSVLSPSSPSFSSSSSPSSSSPPSSPSPSEYKYSLETPETVDNTSSTNTTNPGPTKRQLARQCRRLKRAVRSLRKFNAEKEMRLIHLTSVLRAQSGLMKRIHAPK